MRDDSITVMVAIGAGIAVPQEITATRRGRSVKATVRYRKKIWWLDVEELAARSNRPVGSTLSIRLENVVFISEHKADLP